MSLLNHSYNSVPVDADGIEKELYDGIDSDYAFSWMNKIFRTSQEKLLQEDDFYVLPYRCTCRHNGALLKNYWGKSNLLRALRTVFGCEYLMIGLLILTQVLINFLGPIFLNMLVSCVSIGCDSKYLGLYTILLVLSKVTNSFLSTQSAFRIARISISMQAAIKTNLYQKMLRLSTDSRRNYVAGTLSNLYTVDVERVVNVCMALHNFWALPLQIVVAMALLFNVVSFAMFAGLGTIMFILCLNNYISFWQKKVNDRLMKSKDDRMKAVSEMFKNLLNVKFMVWEVKFVEKINFMRGNELKYIATSLGITAVNIWLLWMAPQAVSTTTIAAYTLGLKDNIEASKIFTAISLFRLLQDPLRSLPSFITQYYQALTSLERLQKFYDMNDKNRADSVASPKTIAGSVYTYSSVEYCWIKEGVNHFLQMEIDDGNDKPNRGSLEKSGSFVRRLQQRLCRRYTSEEIEGEESKFESNFILSFPSSLQILPCQLVVCCGAVGSGKSSVCSALMGEMYPRDDASKGGLHVCGSIAYASQQSWIQNASLRENILFGLPFVSNKYDCVVDACLLGHDFADLPQGEHTFIGEKGLNLSGGQRARVALARAVYADADILVLDDIFAALDAIVAKSIFVRCILNLCRYKTRIIVTHNLDIINHEAVDTSLAALNGNISVVKYREDYDRDRIVKGLSEKIAFYTFSAEAVLQTPALEKNCSFINMEKEALKSFGKLEERAQGKVDASVYKFYLKCLGGLTPIVFLCLVQLFWQSLSVSADFFLSNWSQESASLQVDRLSANILEYAAFSLGSGLTVLIRTVTISYIGFYAAKKMFDQMLMALVHAPMNWHDNNPSGRILNRMSDDQARIDCELPIAVGSVFATLFSVMGDILTVCGVTRGFLLLPLLPTAYVYRRIMNIYLHASREIKRLQSISQSPILTMMSESIDGMCVIRSFGEDAVERLVQKNERLIDNNSNMIYIATGSNAWFVLRIQFIGTTILFLICAITLFLGRSYLSAGLIALSITYGLSISKGLEGLVAVLAWFENNMVCPERIQQYVAVAPEGTLEQRMLFREPTGDKLGSELDDNSSSICGKGSIVYDNVSFSYQPQGDIVLKNISFVIRPGEKVGIVGRTGSGKSSLSMCLFRIAELTSGRILIDDIDISTLNLSTLRMSIQIIPQNPVIFKGKLKDFVDPFSEYADDKIMLALQKSQMVKVISRMILTKAANGSTTIDQYLNFELEENGENLSVGERQMLVLARAILRGASILILDESTANVDYETDKVIQDVLREEFRQATVLTIAHRINTIMSCDRVIVMSQGAIVEIGSPAALIEAPKSVFKDLYHHNVMG